MTAVAIFGLGTITSAQVPWYVPTTGLVGYWPFNGNANDESGNGNNGTVNGAVLTADRNGNTNSAYSFDGISNYIEVPSSPSLCVSIAYSFSAWAYISSYNSGGFPYQPAIVSKINGGDWYGGYEVRASSDATGVPKFLGTSGNIGGNNVATAVPNNNINQWYNIIATYDGSIIKCFINGICMDSTNASGSLQTSTIPLRFGRRGGGPSFDCWLTGFIDDIGIWNRALTQAEITALYNGCSDSDTVATQPINLSVNISNNAQFTTASSDSMATYQWQTDLGVGYLNLNGVGQYSGTTNDTLTVSNVTMSNNNQPFRCIISSGSCTETSDVAVLTVNNIVGINETSQDKLFSVFPNPAQSVINVKADSKLIGEVYTIYDNTGRVVLSGKLNSQNTTIELGNLSGGIYMLSVGENLKQTFKVIKE